MRRVFLTVLSASLLAASAEAACSESVTRRELCGPLAVKAVLSYFGKQVPLADLTEEVYRDSCLPVSSMAALGECLQRRGIDSFALHVGKDRRIEWRDPVIIHVPAPVGGPDGHFAVILPHADANEANGQCTVLWSPGVLLSVPWRRLGAARSRIVLLTSSAAIDRREVLKVRRSICWIRAALILTIGVVLAVSGIRFLSVVRRIFAMKTFFLVTLVSVSLSYFLTSNDDRVFPASMADVTGLLGAQGPYRYCIYENTVTCDHALPAEDCDEDCIWHDAYYPGNPEHPHWGHHGQWKCPDGMDLDVKIRLLYTTIARNDTEEDGWSGDKLKDEAEDCNTIRLCGCASAPAPKGDGYEGPPACEPEGEPLESPTGLFREPVGDQDCNPFASPDY